MAMSRYQSLRETQLSAESPRPLIQGFVGRGYKPLTKLAYSSGAGTRPARPGPQIVVAGGPVWIDILPFDGLETARPGWLGYRRDKAHFAIFGLSNTAFQRIRIVP